MRIDPTYGTFYYQDDHEGSVTHLTSSSGTVLEKYKYDVFGAPSIFDGGGNPLGASAKNNRFLFTGREYTSTFGVYEYRARAYHPGLGRFTGEDPKDLRRAITTCSGIVRTIHWTRPIRWARTPSKL